MIYPYEDVQTIRQVVTRRARAGRAPSLSRNGIDSQNRSRARDHYEALTVCDWPASIDDIREWLEAVTDHVYSEDDSRRAIYTLYRGGYVTAHPGPGGALLLSIATYEGGRRRPQRRRQPQKPFQPEPGSKWDRMLREVAAAAPNRHVRALLDCHRPSSISEIQEQFPVDAPPTSEETSVAILESLIERGFVEARSFEGETLYWWGPELWSYPPEPPEPPQPPRDGLHLAALAGVVVAMSALLVTSL